MNSKDNMYVVGNNQRSPLRKGSRTLFLRHIKVNTPSNCESLAMVYRSPCHGSCELVLGMIVLTNPISPAQLQSTLDHGFKMIERQDMQMPPWH